MVGCRATPIRLWCRLGFICGVFTYRLSGSPVVSYSEVREKGTGREKSAGRKASQAGTGGFQPEIYTEEDEKLLGSAKSEWQLFVDGYDSKGSRIYDPVRGKTCHQCRYLASTCCYSSTAFRFIFNKYTHWTV